MRPNGVIEPQQFDKADLEEMFRIAKYFANCGRGLYPQIMAGKKMVELFYEPSTRTMLSFGMAMLHLGGAVFPVSNAKKFSSAAKGESLPDTFLTTRQYEPDVIVLRHPEKGSAEIAQKFSNVVIINAGDGAGSHPTQAFLDTYTIDKHFPGINDIHIFMVGDLLNGRTVRSLCYILAKHFSDVTIHFVSPKEVRMEKDIKEYLDKYGVNWYEEEDFTNIGQADVVYQTRVQVERFDRCAEEDEETKIARVVFRVLENLKIAGISQNAIDSAKESFCLLNQPKVDDVLDRVKEAAKNLIITPEVMKKMKPTAILMHPLPRVDEIAYAVDKDPRSIYFEQCKNGMHVRMALLKMLILDHSI